MGRAGISAGAAAQANVILGATADWPAANWWQGYADPQLTALITEGLASAPDMKAAEARAMKARAAVKMSNANMLPSISASGATQLAQQSQNMGLPIQPGWDDTGRLSLDFNWEIDFWGKNRAAYRAALSDATAAEKERAQAALVLSTAIASQYAQLSAQYADYDAAKEALNVRTQTLDLMTKRQKAGLENAGAVARAASAQASAKGELVAIEEAMALTRYRIAMLIGAGPDRAEQINRPTAVGKGSYALPAQLPVELIGRRPDVAAARQRIQSAEQRIKVAERSFYPNVNLTAFVGLNSLSLSNLVNADSFMGSAGPAVSLPIFQGGRSRANYRMSEADFELAVAQ